MAVVSFDSFERETFILFGLVQLTNHRKKEMIKEKTSTLDHEAKARNNDHHVHKDL